MVVLNRVGPPEEGVRHSQPNTEVFMDRRSLGVGTLFISEARVSWVGAINPELQKFSIEYPHIAMHAVSRDLSQFPKACLYCVIDVRLIDSDATPASTPKSKNSDDDDDEDDNNSDDGHDEGITEMRFVPENSNALDDMFNAMTACQALHPDPADISEDDNDEDEEEEGVFDDAEEDDEEEESNDNDQETPMDAS